MCDKNRCAVCGHLSDDTWCDDICFMLRNPEPRRDIGEESHKRNNEFYNATRYGSEPSVLLCVSNSQMQTSNTAGKYRYEELNNTTRFNGIIRKYCIQGEVS